LKKVFGFLFLFFGQNFVGPETFFIFSYRKTQKKINIES